MQLLKHFYLADPVVTTPRLLRPRHQKHYVKNVLRPDLILQKLPVIEDWSQDQRHHRISVTTHTGYGCAMLLALPACQPSINPYSSCLFATIAPTYCECEFSLTLAIDLDNLWPHLLITGKLWSWPVHWQKITVQRSVSSKDRQWTDGQIDRRTDTSSCFTVPSETKTQ